MPPNWNVGRIPRHAFDGSCVDVSHQDEELGLRLFLQRLADALRHLGVARASFSRGPVEDENVRAKSFLDSGTDQQRAWQHLNPSAFTSSLVTAARRSVETS